MLFSTPVNPFGTLGIHLNFRLVLSIPAQSHLRERFYSAFSQEFIFTQILDMTHHLKNEEKLLIKEFRAISKQLLSFMSKIAKWEFSLKICFSQVLAFPALEYTKYTKKE